MYDEIIYQQPPKGERQMFYAISAAIFMFGSGIVGCLGVIVLPPIPGVQNASALGGVVRFVVGVFVGGFMLMLAESMIGSPYSVKGWIALVVDWAIVLSIFGGWFWRPILRFWYRLTPHPAADTVHSAIFSGEALDGAAFARIVEAPSTGNTLQDEVRMEQARDLASEWRRHEEQLRRTEADLLADEHERVGRENKLLEAQRDLLNAAIDHEKAAARVAALQRETERQAND